MSSPSENSNTSPMGEKIHSGQFMISKYDEESDSEDSRFSNKIQEYNFESSSWKTNFIFSDGTQEMLNIDCSLQKMFQFLSLAMSGKITNPKWNSFKGVKFQTKDKIRLNNIIWREYHMQFVKKLKPVVVQFASPLSESPQILGTVVLEGKYWKREKDIIIHQYNKWREFSKHKCLISSDHTKSAALFKSIHVQRNGQYKFDSSGTPPNLNDIFMDLDDLDLPYCGLSEGELISEIMQPQLTNLQPRMDSSIDFLNEFLCSPQKAFKNKKLFSSESCLNSFESSQKLNPQSKSGQDKIPTNYFQSPVSSLTTDSVPNALFEMSHQQIMSKPGIGQYSQQAFSTSDSLSIQNSEHGYCKTPNLLSILLQPVTASAAGRISDPMPVSAAAVAAAAATGHNSATRTAVSNYAGSNPRSISIVGPLRSATDVSQNTLSATVIYQNPSMTTCNDQHVPTANQPGLQSVCTTGEYRKSRSPSLFSQSMKMKHSLSANNVVQQYLEVLNSILTSKQDQNKISKAALLHKAAEHIKRLRTEKYRLQSEIIALQNEIDALQNRFNVFCSQLPATGVCLNSNRSSEGRKWFDELVVKVSASNWKFYIFCMMFESLFTSYNNSVSTLSMEALAHNVASWLEKECSLMKLRLIVINGMRTLSRQTSIVHSPGKIIDEIKQLACTSQWANEKHGPGPVGHAEPLDQNVSKQQIKFENMVDSGWAYSLAHHHQGGPGATNPDGTSEI